MCICVYIYIYIYIINVARAPRSAPRRRPPRRSRQGCLSVADRWISTTTTTTNDNNNNNNNKHTNNKNNIITIMIIMGPLQKQFRRLWEKGASWHFWEVKGRLTGVPKKSICQIARHQQ